MDMKHTENYPRTKWKRTFFLEMIRKIDIFMDNLV